MSKLQSHANPLQAVLHDSDGSIAFLAIEKMNRQLNLFSYRQGIHRLNEDAAPAQVRRRSSNFGAIHLISDFVDELDPWVPSDVLRRHDLFLGRTFRKEATEPIFLLIASTDHWL